MSDAHFYICKFYDFAEGVPSPASFCEKLARLHSSSTSPEGKFGFHCTTYNGNLPQDNTWSESWEKFFNNGLRHVLKVREERAGPSPELELLSPTLFDKVIPRLLRPLETGGRKITPSLVHGDLWCGNAGIIDEDTDEGIVYDPSSFWAHNECRYPPLSPSEWRWWLTMTKLQTSSATGDRSGTSSQVCTFRRTTRTSRSPSQIRTMKIEMLSMRCKIST